MSGLQSGRRYRIIHLGNGTRLSDGTGHEKWRLVQYGPYWTIQNTHTSQYLMTHDVRNPVGKDITMGHMQIGWKLAERGGNYYMIALWTSINRGPTVVLDWTGSDVKLRTVTGGNNQVWEFRPV